MSSPITGYPDAYREMRPDPELQTLRKIAHAAREYLILEEAAVRRGGGDLVSSLNKARAEIEAGLQAWGPTRVHAIECDMDEDCSCGAGR